MEEEESTVRWLLFWWITLVASVAFSASPFESGQRCSGIHTSDYTLHGLEAKLDMQFPMHFSAYHCKQV